MKLKIAFYLFIANIFILNAQEEKNNTNWNRLGFVFGYAANDKFIAQDSDYRYDNTIYKFSAHYSLITKPKHTWELSIEPSYYSSKHESFNPWQKFYVSVDNPDYYREKYMKLKSMNEYVLNLGLIYRYLISKDISVYALGNVGPMYMDTDTEMLKKGFAFSDIFALGVNYKINKFSIDFRTFARHVSNADMQFPNYGFNSIGFEMGTYYELN